MSSVVTDLGVKVTSSDNKENAGFQQSACVEERMNCEDSTPEQGKPGAQSSASDAQSSHADDMDTDMDMVHRFAVDETILIFDWDDTVLPSFWVQQEGLRLDADSVPKLEHQQQLINLARFAAQTMSLAKTLGTVVLVTNAERGWIELSCQKFLPALYPSLESVKIISARSEYETNALPSPFDWKLKAFNREIECVLQANNCARRNVISVGDSAHEREALINATKMIPNCRTKSLKFVERPTIDQLCKEHVLMCGCLKRIVHHDGNLDLCINPI